MSDFAETATLPATSIRVRIGRFLFTYRNGIVPVVALAMLLFMRPVLFMNDPRADLVLDIVGFAIAFAGQSLRGIVIGLAYIKRGGTDRRIDAPVLVREGIFSLSRNPLYVGNMLIVLGLVVIYNSPWAYAIVLPVFFFAYLCIIEAEEEFLHRKFGPEYGAYCAEVNRFFPTPGKAHWAFEGGSFSFKRVLRKDYGTAFFWYSLALGLMAWERIWAFGYDAARRELVVFAALWALGLVAWGTARFLKKRKYLSDAGVAAR